MCGIAGIITFDGREADESVVASMCRILGHRGPDAMQTRALGIAAIGNTRLAIIDVAGGNQPIENEEQNLWLVCNGEIYNHQPLRAELQERGHHFRTSTDVEVILHLYEEMGTECFTRLNGMFGAAIFDQAAGRLILARDPFGQKPLYLFSSGRQLAFSSEAKAFRALSQFQTRLSPEAISSYLALRYVPAPLSAFRGVKKLPPGSSLVVDSRGREEEKRYWCFTFHDDENPPPASPGDLRRILRDSVSRHLMSERPLGVFLSGGVDSSAIISLMRDLGHQEIKTYSVGFTGFKDNELEQAARVAEHFKTDHHEVLLDPEQFWDTLDQVVYSADEPLADLTAVPLYHLARAAAKEVVVVLSGEGADELLAGYNGLENKRRQFDRVWPPCKHSPLAAFLLGRAWPRPVAARLMNRLGSAAEQLAAQPFSATTVFDQSFLRRHCLDREVRDSPSPLAPLAHYYAQRPSWHGLSLIQGGMMEWWLPDDLLHKADRMTMAHSLELRCPFLDLEFAAFCSRLAPDDRALGTDTQPNRKVILKNAFRHDLPTGIALQSKKGFVIPAYGWLKDTLGERVRAEFQGSDGIIHHLFSRATLRAIGERAAGGSLVAQHQVWDLIVLNKWSKHWMQQ